MAGILDQFEDSDRSLLDQFQDPEEIPVAVPPMLAKPDYDPSVPLPPAPAPGPSGVEAVARGAVRGATAATADEGAGILNMLGSAGRFGAAALTPQMTPEIRAERQAAQDAAAGDYRAGRDAYRAKEDAARQAHPGKFAVAEVGGGLATTFVPFMGPVRGAGLVKNVARAGARGATEGAAYGAGASEADVTRGEGWNMLRDVGTGAAAGTVVSGAAAGAGALVKKGANAVQDRLRNRILNEVAEGDGAAKTTATGRKLLDKSGDNIVDEVVKGPDADQVRKAYQSGAEKGDKLLQPVIDKVGEANRKSYEAFEAAGRADLSTYGYLQALEQKAADAVKAGRTRDAQAIRAFAAKAHEAAKESGGLTLTQVRGLTTEAQGIASSVLGSLNEHANAKVAGRVSAVVTEAMDDTLTQAAKGDQALETAAASIRENNKRLNALLTIRKNLEQRKYKEASARSGLVRGAERISNPAAIAGGGAVMYGALEGDNLEEKAKKAAMGLAVIGAAKGIPAAARAVDRRMTTAAIRAAQGQPVASIPIPFTGGASIPIRGKQAERGARAGARVGAGIYMRKDEDEKR